MQCPLEKEERFAFCFWRHWYTYWIAEMVRKWQTESIRRALRSNYSKSTSKMQQDTGGQNWSTILCTKSFFQGLRAWKTDKSQPPNLLNERGCLGTCITADSCTMAVRSLGRARRQATAVAGGDSLRTQHSGRSLQQEPSHRANSITLLLHISCCFLIQLSHCK